MKTAAAPSQSVCLQPLRKAIVESSTNTSIASLIAAQAIGLASDALIAASCSRVLKAVNAGNDVKVLVGMFGLYPDKGFVKLMKRFVDVILSSEFAHILPNLFSKVRMFLQRTPGQLQSILLQFWYSFVHRFWCTKSLK